MNDFFSDFLDRAERMLLDMPAPPKKGYRPVNYTAFYNSPPEKTQEEQQDGEGLSTEGWDSVSTQGWSGMSTEGSDTAVAWNNAGTYQPLARETAKREMAKKEKEAKKSEPSAETVPGKHLVFSRNDIANGIIMAEVLGKPLALRHGRR